MCCRAQSIKWDIGMLDWVEGHVESRTQTRRDFCKKVGPRRAERYNYLRYKFELSVIRTSSEHPDDGGRTK